MSSEQDPPATPWGETVRLPGGGSPSSSGPPLPPAAAAAPASARTGRYIRTEKLGVGGMGEVWKAWDLPLGRWVAVKIPKGGDENELGRFRREAQTAGRLQHPNIAAIYEVGEDLGRPFIAMQFIDGRTLLRVPREDRAHLCRLVRDAARAVHFAHEQGVVHRDLKPENIMVAADERVFVMDFGLARAAEGASSLSASGMTVGTPMYMAPEQARGERVDARADVFSLGLTLYELLSGMRPFESPSVYETLRRVQELEPPSLKGVDPDLETVVFKALAKDPADRYATAQAFADDLESVLAGEAIQARRESLRRKAWRRVRKHPLASGALAALVLALALSGAIGLGARRDRAVAELTSRLESVLKGPWTAERLDAFDRDRKGLPGSDHAARMAAALATAARAEAEAGRTEEARRLAELLGRYDKGEADRVAADLATRAGLWRVVFRGEELGAWPAGALRVQGDRFLPATPGRVLTKAAGSGPAELRGEFEAGWAKATRVGLLLDAGPRTGYEISLTTETPGGKGPFPSFEAAAGVRGLLRAVVLRNDVVIREETLDAAEVVAAGPLRLRAKREGDRLGVQIHERPPLEVVDPFPLPADPKGVFGFVWPSTGLRGASGSRQDKPARPGPLEAGDELFVQGKIDDALERYREAAAKAGPGPLRQEARYKEGLCHLQSNREDAARPLFEDVAGALLQIKPGEDTRWMFLADCQLLLLHFKRPDGLPEATAVLEKLPLYKYPLERLAALLPPDVRGLILYRAEAGNVGPNLQRRPEEHIARAEFSVRATELLEPPAKQGEWRYHGLLRAYLMAGRESDAHRAAETIYRRFGFAGEAAVDQCWMLRLSGKLDDALSLAERAVKENPDRKVERARVRAARGEFDLAMQDVEAVIRGAQWYPDWAAACLLKGFLLEKAGASAADVMAAWRVGLIRNWKGRDPIDLYTETHQPSGMAVLHAWMLGSLTDTIDDAEAEKLLQALLRFSGREFPVFIRLLRPGVVKVTWRNPRARDVARRLAFRDLPFQDAVLAPVHAGWVEFIHQVCLPEGPMSREAEDVVWNLGRDIQEAYRKGVIDERYLLPFGAIVQGNPNTPGMGWREVAKILEPHPALRGPVAWVFGERYAKKGDLANARLFYKSALADAAREPSLETLKPLAQAGLDRLKDR